MEGNGALKYLDEFRDPRAARRLLDEIKRVSTRCWSLMEVCGGQTHSLLRHGIAAELRGTVELIHGPGCPVCVTPLEAIDFAGRLALQGAAGERQVLLASFGDMLRVPGSRHSLLQIKAQGGNVRTVYAPSDAVALARRSPDIEVVFFAVGFETTAPATALAARQAIEAGIDNFSLLTAHVRVQPAMELIASATDNQIDGFLAAGHVCTVTGYESYQSFVKRYALPLVVAGFEPLDLLEAILAAVRQLEAGRAEVENRYARSVRKAGNRAAQQIVGEIYEICDQPWRGFGIVPHGGLQLRGEHRHLDARHRFAQLDPLPVIEPAECRSGEVLAGRIKPTDCSAFGRRCTPEAPLGAPMVSAEGTCAAYYRYQIPLTAGHDAT